MLDFSFENILHSNLINFAIMIAIIAWILVKINLGGKIESLQKSIEKKVTDSDNLKFDAQKFLIDTQKSVENLPNELLAIKENAQTNANNIAQKILDDANLQVKKFEQNTQKNIEREVNKIQSELKQEISEISLNVAKSKIEDKLNQDISLHKKLIDQSIEQLDKVNF